MIWKFKIESKLRPRKESIVNTTCFRSRLLNAASSSFPSTHCESPTSRTTKFRSDRIRATLSVSTFRGICFPLSSLRMMPLPSKTLTLRPLQSMTFPKKSPKCSGSIGCHWDDLTSPAMIQVHIICSLFACTH